VFSGDLGRYDDPTMLDPAAITEAHYRPRMGTERTNVAIRKRPWRAS
jgi:hypothetical protein